MSIHNPLPDLVAGLKEADIHNHGFLPIAAAYCRTLGLKQVVDSMVSTQMELSPGLVVQALVLDVLSGRTPLYHVEDFLANQDRELLLGEKVDAHRFNDTNLARSLDVIFDSGTAKIITELGVRASEIFHLDLGVTSYDTTSTSVWGEYRECEQETPPEGPVITYGHSKDHQPQLKQFMTELLCVDRGVPIFGRTLNGNSSDKTSNHEMLSRISTIMAKHGLGPGAFVYVADSAMVTKTNLEAMENNRFISRLPATFDVCKQAIAEAVDANSWTTIGCLTQHPAVNSRPCAEYKAYEATVELYETDYRAVVIHSSAHDKRRQKKVSKQISTSAETLTKKLKQLPMVYFCEADALAAKAKGEKLSGSLHQVVFTLTPVEIRRRGRPPKEGVAPTNTRYHLSWELVENAKRIQRERELAGCFVMISNVPSSGEFPLDSAGILRTYKGQYSIESDFAFLKDPLIVNDLFLKTPSRIDALGMILIIALMLWRLMERSMRLYLEQQNMTLPGWDNKPTSKPTSYMMTTVFQGIQVIVIKEQRVIIKGPTQRHMLFLAALGLDSEVFLAPNCHAKAIIPAHLERKG